MNIIKKYFPILCGTGAGAFSLVAILKPSNMAPGGVSAIAVMISDFTLLKTGEALFLLNVPLLVTAYLWDKDFFKKTVVGAISFSVFANLWENISLPDTDNIIRALFGGALMGGGVGLVFSRGGSTGGSDIIAWMIKQKNPTIKTGRAILIVDVIIIAATAAVYKSIDSALYAVVALFVSVLFLDRVIEGRSKECKTVFIISDAYRKISHNILKSLCRGVTALKGEGMYSRNDKKVLLCSVTSEQLPCVMKIISDIDSDAFVIVADTREISGNGFNNIDI